MNEIISLLALAAIGSVLVSAAQVQKINADESLAERFPDLTAEERKEVQGLTPETEIFKDYCLDVRRIVMNELKDHALERSHEIATEVFDTASQVTGDVLSEQRQFVGQLSKTVIDPNAEVQEVDSPLVREVQDEIKMQKQNVFGRMACAVRATTKIALNIAGKAIVERMQAIKKQMNISQFVKNLAQFCFIIDEHETTMKTMLEQTKQRLSNENPAQQSFIQTVLFNNLNCGTLKTLNNINNVCQTFKTATSNFCINMQAPRQQAVPNQQS